MPGKFGKGAYKDEPFGLVAIRKRVYAVRAFYDMNLPQKEGVHLARARNPGWDDDVVGALNSMASILGLKPQHVPKVRAQPAWRCACASAHGGVRGLRGEG